MRPFDRFGIVESITTVLVGGEGDIGTLTISTVPSVGNGTVDVRVAKHASTLAALARRRAAGTLALSAGAPANASRARPRGLSLGSPGEAVGG